MFRTSVRITLLIMMVAVVILACTLPSALGFVSTPTPTVTLTPTLTSTPTPTATPLPAIRLEAAEQAMFNGDWDRAFNEFEAALPFAGDVGDRAAAQLGMSSSLLRAGRYQDAVELLDEFIGLPDGQEDLAKGFFFRAEAMQALGRYSEAAQDYQQYLSYRPGRIDAFVHERRGDALMASGDYAEAIASYRAARDASHIGDDLAYEIKIASAHAAAGDHAAALTKYAEVYERTSDDLTKARMDYLMGQAHTALGQTDDAYDRYLDAVENFPKAYDSYAGLVILVDRGVEVNELDRGIVDYYAGQYGVALAAFDRYLVANPLDHDGTVHYFKGLTLRELGEYSAAIQEWDFIIDELPNDRYWDQAWEQKAYTQWAYLNRYVEAVETLLGFVESSPDHARAPEFLFDAASVAERDGELEYSAQIWERVAAEYPTSDWAFRSAFLAGISLYRIHQMESAADTFQRALGVVTDSEDRAVTYLWIGKTHSVRGDDEAARAAWQLAVEADPDGYYSLRAEDLLAGRVPFQSFGVPDFNIDFEQEREKAEEWMRSTFVIDGPEPLSALDPQLANDPRMIRGEELMALGFYGEAKLEFESIRHAFELDAEATYRLMHKFLDLRLYQPAIYASKQILQLAGVDEKAEPFAPAYFSHIRFGPYFGELILPEALNQSYDSLFLFSVIRQESLFESFATSYAAARGLMQIIPSTGEALANQTGWPPGYTADDLYRPVVSIRLGTQYLVDLREMFQGDLYTTLASYNAGPGNAAIWKSLATEDPDLFLEVVRFRQTQDYIRVIYWAFTHYRQLYTQP